MKRTCSLVLPLFALLLAFPIVASAQEEKDEVFAPEDDKKQDEESAPEGDKKAEAKLLVREAFEHVYEGEHALALAKFQQAHEVYPSPKILLNIGTTFKKLGRYAESAKVYEDYLRHPDSDKAREAEVRRELMEAEALVARLRIEVNVADAKLLVDGHPVVLDDKGSVRVDPGSHSIVADKDGYESRTISVHGVKSGEARTVRLGLVSFEERQRASERERALAFEQGQAAALSVIKKESIDTGRRFGAVAAMAIAVQEPAFSAVLGATYGATSRIDAELSAILGGEFGAYVGGRYFITAGRVRVSGSGGVPIFFIDGVNPGIRVGAAAGVLVNNNFGITVDLGVEHYFSLPGELDSTLFVPRLAIEGRL